MADQDTVIVTAPQPRRPLFQKYFTVLFLAVALPLTLNAASESWFSYRAQRDRLDEVLDAEARLAAVRIQGFLDAITSQLAWLVQLPWPTGTDEQRRVDALRLMRQVPAIVSLTLVDSNGRERLFLSRIAPNRIEARTDRSADEAVAGARSGRNWYGEVVHNSGSEPFLTLAAAGNRPSVGVVVAEVNLKLIWNVVSDIRIGRNGHAFVLDRPGRLLAHSDISLVLRGADDATLKPFQKIRNAVVEAAGGVATGFDIDGQAVAAAAAPIAGPDWTVVVEQPVSEAFAPIRAAVWRTAGLLALGVLFAGLLAYWLALRMTGPIRLLQQGTERIGAGHFDHRIRIGTGDEFQRLADSFNSMAADLSVSRDRQERIAKLRRFLAPQVAELVDRTGDDGLLDARRGDIVAVFCDMRGFTAFSAKAPPEEVMRVLSDYYEALGGIVTRYGATLTNFSGDGLMVLVNAPVEAPQPALRATDMALDMQRVVQALIRGWSGCGHELGFGVGLAAGPATVGRIGYETRSDYTAIGSVVNLAARLCGEAMDGEVLIDAAVAEAVGRSREVVFLGQRAIKGYDREIDIFCCPCPKS